MLAAEPRLIQSVELNVVPASEEVQAFSARIVCGPQCSARSLNVPFFGLDFEIAPSKLWLLLLIAAVGGFILNLTPCVLPLIPIKIMKPGQTSVTAADAFCWD